jgi:hypothetical protein
MLSEVVRKNLTGGLACRLRNSVTGCGLVLHRAWSLEGREIVSFIQPRHAFAQKPVPLR